MAPMRKKANVAGEERYPVNEELNRSVAKMEEIHEQLEKMDSEITRKVLEVQQNYKIRREVYLRRNEIIKSISHFWLTMFENHPDLGTLITKQDEEILKYMVSLDVKDLKSGYTITFNFSSNPYFEETKLTKTYSISNDGTISKTSIPIKWKEGTDSANVSAHERIGAKRPFAEDSFIRWFIEETLTHGATDEVCETIRKDIWPDPLKYFREEVYENEFNQNGDDEMAEQDGEEEGTVSDDDDGGDAEDDNEYVDIERISDERGNAKEDEHVDIEGIGDGGNAEEDDEYVDIERISDEENDLQAKEEEEEDDDDDDDSDEDEDDDDSDDDDSEEDDDDDDDDDG